MINDSGKTWVARGMHWLLTSVILLGCGCAADRAAVHRNEAEPAAPAWPPIQEKSLYARRDLRGKPAPPLRVARWLTDVPEMDGKVLLVDFWTTWCGPCVRSIPTLNKWQKKFEGDLVVIGLSDESVEKVAAFLRNRDVGYAIGVDPEGRLANAIGVMGIPHVLVISSDGVVRWQGLPTVPGHLLTDRVLERIIAADRRAVARRDRRGTTPG